MVSAILITRNEQDSILASLNSVGFCDEWIVVDDHSTDNTKNIAKKFGAQVYTRSLDGDYSTQRNWAASKAKGEWLFFIDADEIVDDNLSENIKKATKSGSFLAYKVSRHDVFLGKKLNHGDGCQKIVRLVKKGQGEFVGKVHEVLKVDGDTGVLEGQLIHHSHLSISEFLEKVTKYSQIHVGSTKLPIIESRFNFVILPPIKFFYSYILKLGFLDGVGGFVYSMTMSLHSFLSWSNNYLTKK